MRKIFNLLEKFKEKIVGVIGDIILDEYLIGKVERISPEAPVPVVLIEEVKYNPGGAANVAVNIRELGSKVFLYGIIGKDKEGERVLSLLREKNINTDGVLSSNKFPTIVKTRVVTHNQQIVRIDRERKVHPERSLLSRMLQVLQERIPEMDCLIIEDYEKGLLTRHFISKLKRIIENKKKEIIVGIDPKYENFFSYKNFSLLKANLREAESVFGKRIKNTNALKKILYRIKERTNCRNIVITIGEKGMLVLNEKGSIWKIPSLGLEVYDVTGAGDTVISFLTLAYASGFDLKMSACLSSIAAGIEVTKFGASPVSLKELKLSLKKYWESFTKKIETIDI